MYHLTYSDLLLKSLGYCSIDRSRFEALVKGAGHKYVRKVPTGKFTKTGKPRYRYYYKHQHTHGGGVGNLDEIKQGSKFKLEHDGQPGHFHIESEDGDKIVIVHDETGHRTTTTKQKLAELLEEEYGGARKEQATAKRERAVKRAMAVLKEARKHGSEGHIQAAERRVKRLRQGHPPRPAPTGEAESHGGITVGDNVSWTRKKRQMSGKVVGFEATDNGKMMARIDIGTRVLRAVITPGRIKVEGKGSTAASAATSAPATNHSPATKSASAKRSKKTRKPKIDPHKVKLPDVNPRGMDTADRAKGIRKDLKQHFGWNSKKVSVRISRYSLGSSIKVNIKSPDVPRSIVEKVASRYQTVRRDGWGNILGGGNTYVSVDYSNETIKAVQTAPDVKHAIEQALGGRLRYTVKLRGMELTVIPDHTGDRGQVIMGRPGVDINDQPSQLLWLDKYAPEQMGRFVALHLLENSKGHSSLVQGAMDRQDKGLNERLGWLRGTLDDIERPLSEQEITAVLDAWGHEGVVSDYLKAYKQRLSKALRRRVLLRWLERAARWGDVAAG